LLVGGISLNTLNTGLTGFAWEIWFYIAGALQLFAVIMMYLPRGIVKLELDPKQRVEGVM